MDIMPPDNQAPPHHAPTGLKLWLAIFAVVLVVALSYLVWASNTAPDTTDNSAATKKTTTNETADWKTYTGTYLSFKYPTDWKLVTTGLNDTNLLAQLTSPETQKKIDSGEQCSEVCSQQIQFFYYDKVVDERENKANGSKYTTLEQLVTSTDTFEKIGTVTFNGVSGYDGIRGGLGSYYQVYLSKNSHLYEIFFNHRGTKADVSPTENLIINTYKILN